MRIQAKHISFLLLLFFVVLVNSGYAQNGDAESEALYRVINELELIKLVVDEAERNQSNKARYKFQYTHLEEDIQSIIEGIDNHLTRPNRSPRSIAPLKAEYSE